MLDGVQAFPDTYRFEIALPEILEELFFFIELVFAEDAVGKGLLGGIAEGDLADFGAVVVVAEAPAGIVDDPGLVGKAVAEMVNKDEETVIFSRRINNPAKYLLFLQIIRIFAASLE